MDYIEAWYPVCRASSLTDQPVSRTVVGKSLVLFRDGQGKPAALPDRCPHRSVPLSMGSVVEGTIQCVYHGMRLDGAGRCVEIPGQDTIPPNAHMAAFPAVERWGIVWVWCGAPHAADPASVPELPWLDDPKWTAVSGEISLAASYELLLENVHNHTHLQFVHRNTIGTDSIVTAKTTKQVPSPTGLYVERWLYNSEPPALFAKAGGFHGKVDRWFNSEFLFPNVVVLDIGCAPVGTGAPEGDRSKGIEIRSIHCVAPERVGRCRYMWSYARKFAIDSQEVSQLLESGAKATFEEDVEVLEAQQAKLDEDPTLSKVDFAFDGPGNHVRRLLKRGTVQRRAKPADAIGASAQ